MKDALSIQRFGELRLETQVDRFLVAEREPQHLHWRDLAVYLHKEDAVLRVRSLTRHAIRDLKRRLEDAEHDLRVLDWMVERDRSA